MRELPPCPFQSTSPHSRIFFVFCPSPNSYFGTFCKSAPSPPDYIQIFANLLLWLLFSPPLSGDMRLGWFFSFHLTKAMTFWHTTVRVSVLVSREIRRNLLDSVHLERRTTPQLSPPLLEPGTNELYSCPPPSTENCLGPLRGPKASSL